LVASYSRFPHSDEELKNDLYDGLGNGISFDRLRSVEVSCDHKVAMSGHSWWPRTKFPKQHPRKKSKNDTLCIMPSLIKPQSQIPIESLPQTPPLGFPVPDHRHAVSVQLPTWQDMCGMVAQEPRVTLVQQIGYPRSFLNQEVVKVGDDPTDSSSRAQEVQLMLVCYCIFRSTTFV